MGGGEGGTTLPGGGIPAGKDAGGVGPQAAARNGAPRSS